MTRIRFEAGPRLSTIVLNAPPLNIIDIAMMEEIQSAWREAEDLKSQVVVFSSAGDRAFSAGVEIRDHTPDRVPEMLERLHGIVRQIQSSDIISIAALRGHTLGGGAELALSCDFVIAAANAQIGQPEIHLGCFPPVAAAVLPDRIGWHRAVEMVLLGEPVAAQDAWRLGLVNRVVDVSELEGVVDELAGKLLAKSAPVLQLTKRALRSGSLDRSERVYLDELLKLEDMQEGIRAFLEKRDPVWKNR